MFKIRENLEKILKKILNQVDYLKKHNSRIDPLLEFNFIHFIFFNVLETESENRFHSV